MENDEKTNQGSPPGNIWTLTDLRNSKGLSMAKLASMIDVTPATVWQWERKPISELRPKQLKLLEKVFTPGEVDSLLHPEEYFNEDGVQIKPFDPPVEKPEDELPQDDPVDVALSAALREVSLVIMMLSPESRERLVQYADWLYHFENGMRLPSVSGAEVTEAEDIMKKMLSKA